MRVRGLCVLVGVTLAAAGCSVFGETKSYKDQGKICLWPGGTNDPFPSGSSTPVSFVADRPVHVTVLLPACLSSTCSHDPEASCRVEVTSAGELRVTSEGSYREGGLSCTDDCGFLIARCDAPALPAGTYVVRHGADQLTLTVPSTVVPPCMGQAP